MNLDQAIWNQFMKMLCVMNYSKRIDNCYRHESCTVFEIPLNPPFSKGEISLPLFGKEGIGEICNGDNCVYTSIDTVVRKASERENG